VQGSKENQQRMHTHGATHDAWHQTFPLNYCVGNKYSTTRIPPSKPPKKGAITTAPIKALSTRMVSTAPAQSPIGHAQPLKVK
jgi:hypothetical protein